MITEFRGRIPKFWHNSQMFNYGGWLGHAYTDILLLRVVLALFVEEWEQEVWGVGTMAVLVFVWTHKSMCLLWTVSDTTLPWSLRSTHHLFTHLSLSLFSLTTVFHLPRYFLPRPLQILFLQRIPTLSSSHDRFCILLIN